MPIRFTRLSVLLILLAFAASCGDSAPPAAAAPPATAAPNTPASGPLSPCDVLTPADITSVLGEPVQGPERTGFECAFRRPGSGGLSTRAVRLRLEEGDATPYELFERYKANIQTALGTPYEPEPVLGVGTVAAWDGDALLASAGLSRTRSAFLIVQLDGVPAENERQFAEALASAALSRLRTLRP